MENVVGSNLDVNTVLVLSSGDADTDDRACVDLLTRHRPDESNVLGVTFDTGPDDRLSVWQRFVGEELPRRAAIVDARHDDVADAGDAGDAAVSALPSVEVDVLGVDADLLDLAVTVAARRGAWTATESPTQLCFDPLDDLCGRYSSEELVGFVRAMNALADHLGVFSHHHLDPERWSESTVEALRPLYGAVVEHRGDGWVVSEATRDEAPRPTGGRPTDRRPMDTDGATAPTPPDPSAVPFRRSLDRVLDLVGDPVRRSLLYDLSGRSTDPIPIRDLVDALETRLRTSSLRKPLDRDSIAIRLRHVHLPALEEAGLLTVDREHDTVEYESNPALESWLAYLEAIERD